MSKFRIAALFITILLISLLTVILVVVFLSGPEIPARVTTDCGEVEGTHNKDWDAYSFKGIPYAAAPIKERRWKPPQPISGGHCWNEVLQAKSFPAECGQYLMDKVSGAEDCLYLNIFTPSLNPNASLPVMVWIHGGYLLYWNGSLPGYSPDVKLARTLNMVHVSIQYRLGGLGFLVLDALPGRGNYGLLDQIEALRWVQRNIAKFGGDPNLVTIYGHSSGGTSVWALMMSPPAKGLFHRAWSLSQSGSFTAKLEEAKRVNGEVLLQEGSLLRKQCPVITEECLMNLSFADAVMGVFPFWNDNNTLCGFPTPGENLPGFLVIDGDIIPEAPLDAWDKKTGNYSDVPFIISSTAQETEFSPSPGFTLKNWNREELSNHTASKLDAFSTQLTQRALELYPWQHDAVYVYASMTTDIRETCPLSIVAEKASMALSSPVYYYVLTSHPSSVVPNVLGFGWDAEYAFHGWDTYAFFDYMNPILSEGLKESDDKLRRILHEEIGNFVHYGRVKDPRWLDYAESTALISDQLDIIDKYKQEECDMWIQYDMQNYSWVN